MQAHMYKNIHSELVSCIQVYIFTYTRRCMNVCTLSSIFESNTFATDVVDFAFALSHVSSKSNGLRLKSRGMLLY